MPGYLQVARRIVLGASVLGAAAVPLLGAEHILLRDGFDLICDHREVVGDRVRLYLTAADVSFVEVSPQDIVSSEPMELPAPQPAAQPVSLTPVADPTPAEIREMTAKAGRAHDLDVDLLASVIRAESNGNVHAVSRAGARGLMQLMPSTAGDLGVQDSFRAEDNINGGTQYLNDLLVRYHDNLALALAAYNAGPAAVDKYHGIPPFRETRAYVARIIRDFNQRKATQGRSNAGLIAAAATVTAAGK